MSVHPAAIVSPSANIESGVEIGPLAIIEDDVSIGSGSRIASHVVIKRGTKIGKNNIIDVGVVLGGDPQHMGAGEVVGETEIGDGNLFREYVTVHRGYQPEHVTRIGHYNMFMASSHVGHDCELADHNILANNVMLGGHVTVGCRNYFGGGVALHQFCRVGSYAMIGGLARITRDVPPYVLVDGDTSGLVGLNSVGLRRAGMPPNVRRLLKSAYRIAFRESGSLQSRLEQLRNEYPDDPVRELWSFLADSRRGFLQDRRAKTRRSATTTEQSPESGDDVVRRAA